MSRLVKPTDSQRRKIVYLVGQGVPVEVACAAEGIDKETLAGWLQRAREGGSGNGTYMSFAMELNRARAKSEASLVTKMYALADEGDQKAIAWLLERGFDGRYARVSVSGGKTAAGAEDKPMGMPGNFDDLDNVEPIDSVRRRARGA